VRFIPGGSTGSQEVSLFGFDVLEGELFGLAVEAGAEAVLLEDFLLLLSLR
jgi:hypothetical protein